MHGFEPIAPHRGEEFREWFARVRQEIPHVPEVVAYDWLHRNWVGNPYGFLPLARMRFELETWTTTRIVDEIVPLRRWRLDSAEERLDHNLKRNRCKLAETMIARGTWPVPVLILDNPELTLREDDGPMGRWHLIEGHLRLTYLHALARRTSAQPSHELWVSRIV